MTELIFQELTYAINGAAMEVHRILQQSTRRPSPQLPGCHRPAPGHPHQFRRTLPAVKAHHPMKPLLNREHCLPQLCMTGQQASAD